MDSAGGRVETRPLTAEEEAVKRNTDCIYFLASPLTCKKGSDCEYRHSEGARLNPRDCYYWLHSNCLNPKCAFRHPPLDGLFGPPGTPSGLAMPPSLTVPPKPIPMAHSPAYNATKQSVGCIYFQKGQCLKGERCPFSHGPQATGNGNMYPSLQRQPQAFKEDMFGLKQCNNQQNNTKVTAESIIQAEGPPFNGSSHTNYPRSQSVHASVINNNAWSRTQSHHIHPSDDVEPGEIIGVYSSGFDSRDDNVNVKSSGDYGRNQRSNSVGEVKRNVTERSLDRYRLPERRVQQSGRSPEEVNRVDLRHRLKKRKMDEFRSTVSISTRLGGRMNLPETSARNLGGRLTQRDVDSPNFSGPKSLAELRGSKIVGIQERSTRITIDASFEGPKPLSALLKRKREEVCGAKSGSGDENNPRNEGDVAKEDREIQNFEQGGVESDYEVTETGNLKREYESQGEEDDELDDDEEDFARKVGLIFS